MRKTVRKSLVVAGGVFAALFVIAVGLSFLIDLNRYKPQIEAAVAKATGMGLKINGDIALKLFPRVRASIQQPRLTRGRRELFSAERVELEPRLMPLLLRREVILDRVVLLSPNVQLGSAAPAGKSSGGKEAGAIQVREIDIREGRLAYVGHGAKPEVQVSGLDAEVSDIRMDTAGAGRDASLLRQLSFRGRVRARTFQAERISASDIKAEVLGERGLIVAKPLDAKMYGGNLQGSAQIDFRGAAPVVKISQTVSHLDIAQAPAARKIHASGLVDGTVDLTASGSAARQLLRTANGMLAIHGQNLVITGVNIDELAGKLKTAEGLDFVKIGSSLVSSLLGPLAGGSAGSGSGGAGVKTVIRKLVANWKIERGIAQAQDVALATSTLTIAFKGGLNLVDERYRDFTIATVDPNGCAQTKVEVVGSLSHPQPNTISVISEASKSLGRFGGSSAGTIAGGLADILGRGGGVSPPPGGSSAGSCDLFYTGAALKG